jgi:branched-chain amino acid transport system substrate-binding protein
LKGTDKASGEQARRGILLAVEEANDSEPLVGGRRVEVLHADYGEDKKAITGVAVRLIKVNKVSALLGGADPAQAAALPDVAQRYQVPLIIAGGMPDENSLDYVFHTAIRPVDQAQSLATVAKEKLKAKIVGILTDGNESPNSLSRILVEAFSKKMTEKGADFSLAGKWMYKEMRKGTTSGEVEPDFKSTEDLKGIFNQIQDRRLDAILLAGAPTDLIRLRKAGLNEKTPVLFAGEEGSQKSLQAMPSAQAVYLASAFAPDAPDEPVKKFVQKFRERFQEVPDVHAALAYDNARLLFQGLANVKQLEGSKIKEALDKEETFEGVTGPLNFNVKDRWFSRPVIILRVENGKVEYVKKY